MFYDNAQNVISILETISSCDFISGQVVFLI